MNAVAPLPAVALVEERRHARVLSGPKGPHPASHGAQSKLCLIAKHDNAHELLVAIGTAATDADVLAFESQVQRQGIRPARVKVSVAELIEHYARDSVANRSNSDAGDDTSVSGRQRQVLDLIAKAVATGASDMHFVIQKDICLLRNRVNGTLRTVNDMPRNQGVELCTAIYQSMCDVADATFQPNRPQDARLKQDFLDKAGLFGARIATRPTERGLLMVLRLLYDRKADRRTLLDLGYLEEQALQITRMTQRKTGVNIFSGETGSGKSSSLEVTIRMVIEHFSGELHVLTIEDPPEYRIDGAVQTPKGKDQTWADAIRNAMRLDPNVLMVGEVRDFVSAETALQGALTGHALWTTIHCTDAVAILQRLADFREGNNRLDPSMFTDPSLITGLVNQNLAPTNCTHCAIPYTPEVAARLMDGEQRRRIEAHCEVSGIRFRGNGCDRCGKTSPGVSGRTVVAEVVVPTLEFMRVYREQGKAEARDYWRREMGGITKTEHLIRRINEGRVDPRLGEQMVGLVDEDERT